MVTRAPCACRPEESLHQQVGYRIDDYQLTANAWSGLSAGYIPMLNQLRTMQPLDLTMVN